MVGVSRSTLYNHIEQKRITVEPDLNGKPMIDTAELIRIYGDQVKMPDTPNNVGSDTERHEKKRELDSADSVEMKYLIENLREKVSSLETERERERQQASEMIEILRSQVEKADAERQKLTAVLTDQRSEQQKKEEKERLQTEKFSELQKMIEELKERQDALLKEPEKRGIFKRIFGSWPIFQNINVLPELCLEIKLAAPAPIMVKNV